jgi:hypothetical protein
LANQAAQSHQRLSKGAAAGIVLVVLVVVGVAIFILLRRRNRARRSAQTEERRQWWFNGERTSSQFDDAGSMSSRGAGTVGSRGAGRVSPEDRLNVQSVRSSFGTSVDRGLAFSAESYGFTDEIPPSLPPMIEVERQTIATVPSVGHGSVEQQTIATVPSVGHGTLEHHNSSRDSQHLTIPDHGKRDSDQSSLNGPMSVRPFSPSESLNSRSPPQRMVQILLPAL